MKVDDLLNVIKNNCDNATLKELFKAEKLQHIQKKLFQMAPMKAFACPFHRFLEKSFYKWWS